jgi:hypothetical protein
MNVPRLDPRCPLDMGGSQSRSGHSGEEIVPAVLEIEPRYSNPQSHKIFIPKTIELKSVNSLSMVIS